MIELVNIKLRGHGGLIFDDLNFNLPAGKTAIINGPTGSGKTSMIELLLGIRKPESGLVLVFGKAIKSGRRLQLASIRKRIGGVGGLFDLISYQTVYENLVHPLVLNNHSIRTRKTKIENSLKRFNLMKLKNECAANLSRGEKMLVMMARSIIADQPLLMIDEPLAGVDDIMAARLKEHLVRLSMAGHTMIILTSKKGNFGLPGGLEYTLDEGGLK
jgi:putative ABC transport system ATP-binding protein